MQEAVVSRTALFTSLIRAIHARCDPLPVFNDPWGDKLVPQVVVDAIRQRALLAQGLPPDSSNALPFLVEDFVRTNAGYAGTVTRSRYTEDALAAALARGVRQYVLIGAGLDSYALRHANGNPELHIFEVDHPATQSFKLGKIKELGVTLPATVHFVAADLSKEGLTDALARSAFKRDQLAFFSWLGVSMYLTPEANVAALSAMANGAAAGSEIVFTYLNEEVFDSRKAPASARFAELQRTVAEVGEPFLSGFDPNALPQLLATIGLHLIEDFADSQLVARYDPKDANGLRPSSHSHVARASLGRKSR